MPVESSQLTGSVYYLNPSNNKNNYIKIDNLLIDNELDSALFYLFLISNFSNILNQKGPYPFNVDEHDKAISDYKKALEIDSYYPAMVTMIVNEFY